MSLCSLCTNKTKIPEGSVPSGRWQIPMYYDMRWFKVKFKPPQNIKCLKYVSSTIDTQQQVSPPPPKKVYSEVLQYITPCHLSVNCLVLNTHTPLPYGCIYTNAIHLLGLDVGLVLQLINVYTRQTVQVYIMRDYTCNHRSTYKYVGIMDVKLYSQKLVTYDKNKCLRSCFS